MGVSSRNLSTIYNRIGFEMYVGEDPFPGLALDIYGFVYILSGSTESAAFMTALKTSEVEKATINGNENIKIVECTFLDDSVHRGCFSRFPTLYSIMNEKKQIDYGWFVRGATRLFVDGLLYTFGLFDIIKVVYVDNQFQVYNINANAFLESVDYNPSNKFKDRVLAVYQPQTIKVNKDGELEEYNIESRRQVKTNSEGIFRDVTTTDHPVFNVIVSTIYDKYSGILVNDCFGNIALISGDNDDPLYVF
jgi:hypothetical protein